LNNLSKNIVLFPSRGHKYLPELEYKSEMSTTNLADDSAAGRPSITTYRFEYGETAKLHYGNYNQWSSNIQVFLRAINALDIVLGVEEAPLIN